MNLANGSKAAVKLQLDNRAGGDMTKGGKSSRLGSIHNYTVCGKMKKKKKVFKKLRTCTVHTTEKVQ